MENEIEAKNVAEQGTSSHREQRLVLGSSGQEPEQKQCGITHYAGCAYHEQGWENKWKAAIEMAARAELERDMWKANHDNQVAIKRIIATRPDLKDRAPMVEKLMAERNRAQGWSTLQHERIKRLESTLAKWIEWARMHGHLEHAAGIADDSRRLISSENDRVVAPAEGSPNSE